MSDSPKSDINVIAKNVNIFILDAKEMAQLDITLYTYSNTYPEDIPLDLC